VRGRQTRQAAPAGDQHQAAGGAGQQRRHLLLAARVVQHDQDPPVGEDASPQPAAVVQLGRDPFGAHAERAQHPVQRVARIDRDNPLGEPVQVDEELPVREMLGQLVCGVYCQRGLADPGHPVDRRDHHLGTGQRLGEQGPLVGPPGETDRVGR
jgi:hypothetical protein